MFEMIYTNIRKKLFKQEWQFHNFDDKPTC